jgi:hypothetical protein
MTVRRIGATKSYGVPLVAGVSVTSYQRGVLERVCSSCGFTIELKRAAALVVSLVPAAIAFGIAGAKGSALAGGLGLVLAILAFRGLFYSWVDGLIWGKDVVRRAGLPPGDYQFPAGILSVLFRGVALPFGMAVAIAIIGAILTRGR